MGRCRLRRLDLGELPLNARPELREERATLPDELVQLGLDAADLVLRLVDQAVPLGPRLAQDELRLAVRLLPDLAPELLG
jgi:hypothetical protein